MIAGSPGAWAAVKPPLCPPARYLVADAALVPGAATDADVVTIAADGTVTVESGCPATLAPRRATRKGTKVKATWLAGSCGAGVAGKVKLVARTDAACETLSGKFKAKKLTRRFVARRSRCGDGVADPLETCPLLEYPPTDRALDRLTDRYVLDGVSPAEIADDPVRGRIARTQLEIGFAGDATVGELNAVLAGIDASIVATLEGVLLVVVRIPDPGSLAALDALAADLQADPVVTTVRLAGFLEPAELPANYPQPAPDLAKIDHHLAVRGPAAWNARAALPVGLLAPVVVVGDFFGGGAPGADFDVSDVDGDYGTGALTQHGYHVLGIIAGGFGGNASGPGLVTGSYPATLSVRAADYANPGAATLTAPLHEDVMLAHVASAVPGAVVVNTSLQFPCATAAADAATCTMASAQAAAMAWITKVRGSGFETIAGSGRESQFLHVTAAGNVSVAGRTNAAIAGPFPAAKLLPGLLDAGGTPVPNLTNVLVVENAQAGLSPRCLSASSKRPGDLAAIGTTVWSMTAASGSAGDLNGTSMATPQAAGFAAFLWGLRPSLTPQQVIAILTGASSSGDPLPAGNPAGGCDPTDASQRVLDAYAAVLAADTALDAPVRRTLLDLDADGSFDEQDVEAFLDAFAERFGALDWSRHDLNGDGMTGGDERAPLDLDADEPPALETVTQDIGDSPRSFDETALRDLDVLCYYAWSDLYAGDEEERDLLLAIPCCAGEWVLTRIGNAIGAQASFANAINDDGVVVGLDGDYVPFRWVPTEDDPTQGGRQDLALLPDNEHGGAEDINAAGLIVGSTTDTGIPGVPGSGTQTAVVWTNGVPTAVGPIAQYSAASSINDGGMITGSTNGIGGWALEGTTVHQLGGAATAINNVGMLTGSADFPDFFVFGRPAFWASLTSPPLYLGHFGGFGRGTDVNDAGLIVGTARAPSFPLPFTSSASGGLSQLPTVPGGFLAQWGDAYGVNDQGVIVGSLWLENTEEVLGERAVRWVDGVAEDLNTLMSPADQASFVMAEAFDVNERGQIVGWGVELPFEPFTYHERAFLLTPRCGD